MPSSIPYDPSLVLANIVSMEALDIVKQISAAQAPADAAEEDLNSLIASKRSLDMTKTELGNLGIDTEPVEDAMKDLNTSIATSAASYAKAKIAAEKTIQPLRAKIQSVHSDYESPVDFTRTVIKSLALATDSISMDVQYFSLDSNSQTADQFAASIADFVSESVSVLGKSVSSQMSSSARTQASDQASRHQILGTLVFSVACTHKNAQVMAPFILNVDKGIKAWNHLFPQDRLDPMNANEMLSIAQSEESGTPDQNKFSIISGMTYGSSFVGMVHILNATDTRVSENLSSYANSIQAQMDAGALMEGLTGGFGVDSSISNDVKNLISTQNITSHATMICMGVIPTVVSNQVQMGVQQFANFDPQKNMATVATIQNATVSDENSVTSAANAARTGQSMVSLQAANITSSLSALSAIDDKSNKIIDINSMMTALDDYLKKAQTLTSGVPLNYYLKDIDKGMLAEMFVSKYYPGKYLSIGGDDSPLTQPTVPGGSTTVKK